MAREAMPDEREAEARLLEALGDDLLLTSVHDVIRRPSAALGGRSPLQTVMDGGDAEAVVEHLRGSAADLSGS